MSTLHLTASVTSRFKKCILFDRYPHQTFTRLYRKLSDTKAAVSSTISTLETSLDYSGEYHDFDLYTLFPQLPNFKRFSLSIWIDSALDPLPSLADGLCSCCVNSRLESLTLNIDQFCYIDAGPGIGSLRYLTALKHIRIRAHLWLDGGGRRKTDEGLTTLLPGGLEELEIETSGNRSELSSTIESHGMVTRLLLHRSNR